MVNKRNWKTFKLASLVQRLHRASLVREWKRNYQEWTMGASERISKVKTMSFRDLEVELTESNGGIASRVSWRRMQPMERVREDDTWSPEHEERVTSQQVMVTRRAGERRFHYFEQCGVLQWGHCRVSRNEAIAEGCTECRQCRAQQSIRTWDPIPKTQSDGKWETYAPQGLDKWSGATDWVSIDVPTKLLR